MNIQAYQLAPYTLAAPTAQQLSPKQIRKQLKQLHKKKHLQDPKAAPGGQMGNHPQEILLQNMV